MKGTKNVNTYGNTYRLEFDAHWIVVSPTADGKFGWDSNLTEIDEYDQDSLERKSDRAYNAVIAGLGAILVALAGEGIDISDIRVVKAVRETVERFART